VDFDAVVTWLRRTAVSDGDSSSGGFMDVPVLSAGMPSAPSGPVVLLLFSGRPRVGSLAEHLRAAGATVIEVDVKVGGRFHDLTDYTEHGMALPILRAAEHGDFAAVHSAVPCDTWSVGLVPGSQMRTPGHWRGVPGLPPGMAAKCQMHTALLALALDVGAFVVRSGGEATLENPSWRGDPDEPRTFWAEKSGHASIFMRSGGEFAIDMVREYADEVRAVLVTTPLCAFGAPWQKYISVLASEGAALVLRPAGEYVCTHGGHEAVAYGPGGAAARSGEYPSPWSHLLGRALLRGEAVPVPAVSPAVVAGSQAAIVLGSRVEATTAPGYSAVNPGWWRDDDQDLSDEEVDVHEAEIGGVSTAYKACVKVKVKYSQGADGDTRRHSIPNSFQEAMCHEDSADLWRAVLTEMHAQEDCGTWEQRPASECYDDGRKPIGSRWVFDAKIDNTSQLLLLWKARLVARGDQMVYLRDFFDTYAGVCRIATFRIFLALCALWGLTMTGADVSTAYLHAPLRDCLVWMLPPEGFPGLGFMPDGTPALLRLRMALYGLRQSAREWAITLRQWLLEWEYEGQPTFKRLDADSYVFVWITATGKLVLLLWVDDIFMAHSCPEMRAAFMAAFTVRFRVKDLGLLTQGLGMDISQDLSERTVSFSQERYIRDAARRFHMHVDNAWADIPVPVALAKACKSAQPSDAEREEYGDSCRIMGGIITHIATFSRPDVCVAAQICSSTPPGEARHRLSRRVLGYLARTASLRITYCGAAGPELRMAFRAVSPDGDEGGTGPWMAVDADHAADRSYTGWLFMLAGAAVSWCTRAQPLPSLSSTEAELYGLSTAVCDLLVVCNLLEELGFDVSSAIQVFCDSRGARLLVSDCAAPARTRHIHRRWYFVRHYRETGRIVIKEVKGGNNPANFMTKAVGGAAFARDRSFAMGLR